MEEVDDGVHDGTDPRQGAQVAVDQQPLVGEDVGDDAADPAQKRIGIGEMAGQHGEASAGPGRLVQHQPVVAADLGPAAAAKGQQPAPCPFMRR